MLFDKRIETLWISFNVDVDLLRTEEKHIATNASLN